MLRSIAVTTLLVLSAPALADTPKWNYAEAGWQRIDIDESGIDADADGFGIGGAFELADSWHVLASYQTADFDFGIDFDQLTIGGGYHTAITDTTEFVADLSYVRVEASAGGSSADDDGLAGRIGLRSMLTDQFELAGFITQTELDDSGGDTAIGGQAWYSFTPMFAAGANVSFSDDVTQYGIGFRVYFGQQ